MDLHELGLRLRKATGELDLCLEPPAKMFAFSPLLKVDAMLDLLHYWKWTKKRGSLSGWGQHLALSRQSSSLSAAAAATLTVVFVGVCALPAGVRRNPINLHTDERVQSFAGAGAW